MPAHCTDKDVGKRELSDGSLLSYLDLAANDLVDRMAKTAANLDRVPGETRKSIRQLTGKVKAIARWIGQITVLSSQVPASELDVAGKACLHRDTTATPARQRSMVPAQAGIGARAETAEAKTPSPAHFQARMPGELKRVGHCLEPTGMQKRRRVAAMARAAREEVDEQARLADILASKNLQPHRGPSAQSRLEQIRNRIRGRAVGQSESHASEMEHSLRA